MSELKWEISPGEAKSRRTKALKAGFYFCVMLGVLWGVTVLFTCADDRTYCGAGSFLQSILDMLPWALFVSILPCAIVALTLLVNKIYPHSSRKYVLSNDFLSISKGSKSRTYRWNEFSSFYAYHFTRTGEKSTATDIQAKGLALEKKIKEIGGTKFLLKKKAGILRLMKKFVVIYSEPDNQERVYEYLKNSLPEGKLDEFTDSGFVSLEFK